MSLTLQSACQINTSQNHAISGQVRQRPTNFRSQSVNAGYRSSVQPHAPVRAPHASRAPRARQSTRMPRCALRAARLAPQRAPDFPAACPGARFAPRASRRTPRAAARARQPSRMPGTKTSEKSWKTPPPGITKRVRSRSAIETTHTRTGEPGRLLFQPDAIVAKRYSHFTRKKKISEKSWKTRSRLKGREAACEVSHARL
jgi:hypothetical protein